MPRRRLTCAALSAVTLLLPATEDDLLLRAPSLPFAIDTSSLGCRAPAALADATEPDAADPVECARETLVPTLSSPGAAHGLRDVVDLPGVAAAADADGRTRGAMVPDWDRGERGGETLGEGLDLEEEGDTILG